MLNGSEDLLGQQKEQNTQPSKTYPLHAMDERAVTYCGAALGRLFLTGIIK